MKKPVRFLFRAALGPGWSMTKLLFYLSCMIVFAVSVYVIYQRHEMRLLTEFEALKRADPVPKARQLAADGKYCDALEFLDYYREYDYIKQDPRVRKLYAEIRDKREAYLFILKDVWSGVWRGHGACMESLVSATVTDFLVVGDVRDLVWGAVNKFYGQETDEFTMALAGLGVLLTGVTVAATAPSGGSAVPAGVGAKVSVSMLKLAKKMGKLPKSLQKGLLRLFKQCRKVGSLKPLKPVSRSLYRIARTKGVTVRDYMTVLTRSRNVADVKFMEKVVAAFGKRTGKFLRLGGETPVRVLKKYGKSDDLAKAVDTAIQYGPRGGRLLRKTGPTKFMKYLTMAKYGARATRSLWRQRLTRALAGLLMFLPAWAPFVIAAVTGMFSVAGPTLYVRKRMKRRRALA